ncbi:hypothetical protein BJ986_003147 [Phycicoccus badiiscoriae]|uniref:ABC transporter permease n=1 Tax=Pedococcus badiiscoriae TaxID=642776 RepID=A0A852WIE6_9MICO|nr:ABC transporter permease [Pedococcus badiiscoriae]NYG08660.1 hypothetical protein [Pedococcus badiiscoriae]
MSRLRKMTMLGWVEVTMAAFALTFTVLAIWDRQWVEGVLGAEPDGGDGSLEWLLVVVPAVIACVCAYAARRTWVALAPAAEG